MDVVARVLALQKRFEEIRSVDVFDYYHGRDLAEDSYALGLSVFLRSEVETLQAERLRVISDALVDEVTRRFKGRLRG